MSPASSQALWGPNDRQLTASSSRRLQGPYSPLQDSLQTSLCQAAHSNQSRTTYDVGISGEALQLTSPADMMMGSILQGRDTIPASPCSAYDIRIIYSYGGCKYPPKMR